MNQISLLNIHRKTGLTDRKIQKQLFDGAKNHTRHDLTEDETYPIKIVGPDGTYTLRCAGKRSIHAILEYFEKLQERIDAGHEEQVQRRLADIERQIESLPPQGEQAYQAQKALESAMWAALNSEPTKFP